MWGCVRIIRYIVICRVEFRQAMFGITKQRKVVCSRKKSEYLEALHKADIELGPLPSDGAHAEIKNIRPFLKYFNDWVATEVYNDVLFLSEKNENVLWYDGGSWRVFVTQYTTELLRISAITTLF